MKKLLLVLALLALPLSVDARSRGGHEGGGHHGGGKGGQETPAPGPSAPAEVNGGPGEVSPDTRGSATRPYVSDFCYNYPKDRYCLTK